jgi:ATPase subunit of ABC transporter with duplicated ATPase domains
MIASKEQPDAGTIRIGPSVKLAVVDQTRESLDNTKTVFDDVTQGRDILTIGKFEMPSRAYLGRFNFKGGDQQKPVGTLSGGERGRLHLAMPGRCSSPAMTVVPRVRGRQGEAARSRSARPGAITKGGR